MYKEQSDGPEQSVDGNEAKPLMSWASWCTTGSHIQVNQQRALNRTELQGAMSFFLLLKQALCVHPYLCFGIIIITVGQTAAETVISSKLSASPFILLPLMTANEIILYKSTSDTIFLENLTFIHQWTLKLITYNQLLTERGQANVNTNWKRLFWEQVSLIQTRLRVDSLASR